jgi:hypothetical protein
MAGLFICRRCDSKSYEYGRSYDICFDCTKSTTFDVISKRNQFSEIPRWAVNAVQSLKSIVSFPTLTPLVPAPPCFVPLHQRRPLSFYEESCDD